MIAPRRTSVGRRTSPLGRPDRRELEIVKSRGQSHVAGAHPYEIGGSGITVFPHRYPEPADSAGEPPSAPATLSTGVAGLDSLLGGGPAARSSILVAGLPGTFKTTLAAHFALTNATAERPALWVALNENAAELQRGLGPVGLDFGAARTEGRLHFLELTPGREPIEKTLNRAEKLIAESGVATTLGALLDLQSKPPRKRSRRRRRSSARLRSGVEKPRS